MPLHQMPNARLSKKNQLGTYFYKYSRIVRVVSSVRFEIEQNIRLENCEPFVIYLLNSTGNVAQFEGFYGCAN